MYSIPLECGSFYVGQTGACLNFRLTTHSKDLVKCISTEGKRFVERVRTCNVCSENDQWFGQTDVLFGHNDRTGREIVEAICIRETPEAVSEPSVELYSEEVKLLRSFAQKILNYTHARNHDEKFLWSRRF